MSNSLKQRIKNLWGPISNQKPKGTPSLNPFESLQIEAYSAKEHSLIIATGVGRSGTHFLAELFDSHTEIDAFHLDEIGNSIADSFWMYAIWYNLPIDFTPFLKSREFLSFKAQNASQRFLESNPYLALSIKEIADFFPNSHFIITLRDPRKVVLSHLNKGWYKNYSPNFNPEKALAPGYEYQLQQANHFFGRIFPTSQDSFAKWQQLSQVGKISWMWQEINTQIWKQLSQIPDDRYSLIVLDNFDFQAYLTLSERLEIGHPISEEAFIKFVDQKPGKTRTKKYTGWGPQEEKEFQSQIRKFSPTSPLLKFS